MTLNLFYITVSIVVVMSLLSSIIYFLDRTRIAKHMVELWFSYLFYFMTSILTEGYAPVVVALATLCWPWRIRAYRVILEDLSHANLKSKWDYPVLTLGFLLGTILYFMGHPFGIYTIPVSSGVAIVGCSTVVRCYQKMRHRKLNPVYYIFLGNVMLVFVHILNFPLMRLHSSISAFGFGVALLIIFISAVLLPSLHRLEVATELASKLESLVEERTQQLLNQSKFSALGEMAAGIAHEINNPLAVISGKAGQLMRHVKARDVDQEKLLKGLESIESTAFRISRIIKGLKDFSRNAENIPMQPVTLLSVVNETLDLCRERFYHSGVALEVNAVPEVVIRCRNIQISQVLLNLLNNAFDAVQTAESKWVRLDFENTSSQVIIRVVDSGPGIPVEIQQKIMMPFFTTKEVGKGTGIGLSISKGIIEDHLGNFFLDANATHTTFTVELPKPS